MIDGAISYYGCPLLLTCRLQWRIEWPFSRAEVPRTWVHTQRPLRPAQTMKMWGQSWQIHLGQGLGCNPSPGQYGYGQYYWKYEEYKIVNLHSDPQFSGISLVVLSLHLVQGKEAIQGELVVAQGEVLLHHIPLLVRHLLTTCPPVEQVKLGPEKMEHSLSSREWYHHNIPG